MGKSLIIKGTSFSDVAVTNVNLSQLPYEEKLTPLSYSQHQINSEWKIVAAASWEILYIPIVSGKKYHIFGKWSPVHSWKLGYSTITPQEQKSSGNVVTEVYSKPSSATINYFYTAQANGYLYINNMTEHIQYLVITELEE